MDIFEYNFNFPALYNLGYSVNSNISTAIGEKKNVWVYVKSWSQPISGEANPASYKKKS